MALFGKKLEAKEISGKVLRVGTTKDPSMAPSYIQVMLDSDHGRIFRMQSWAYPLEVAGTERGDQVTIAYTENSAGELKVKSFVNQTYRDDIGKEGDPIFFD